MSRHSVILPLLVVVLLHTAVIFSPACQALDCSACNHVMVYAGGTTHVLDNNELGLAPGSIICWAAHNSYPTGFRFDNFVGNSGSRFIFTNCNGTAVIDAPTHGIVTQYSSYLRITGKYDADSDTEYGVRIVHASKGIAFEAGSTNVELDHVEVTGCDGHAAIIAKTDPGVDGGAFTRPGFVMNDVWLHHNYVHDVDTEAFYIGYFDFENSDAHEIHGLRLYNNIVKNTGWDGIQVGCAISDTEVYNNYVTNYGQANEQSQQTGMILQGGFKGDVYNNRIDSGTGIGILYQGNLDSQVYNNVVINGGDGGISCSINKARTAQGSFTAFHHNTIVGYGGYGLNIYINLSDQTAYASNNVIIGTGTGCINNFDQGDANLCASAVTAEMGFTDANNGDFSLQLGSSLIDQGVACTPNAITTDWNEGPRTDPPDLGAFEYGTEPRNDDGGLAGPGDDGAASTLVSPLAYVLSVLHI